MERVKVRIAGDADSGYAFVSVVPAKAKRTAIYIGPEKSIWLLDQEKALEGIKEYGEQCMSSLMGKSDYIIIYPAESAVEIDGEDYLMGALPGREKEISNVLMSVQNVSDSIRAAEDFSQALEDEIFNEKLQKAQAEGDIRLISELLKAKKQNG